MTIREYIDSGILESYAMGAASDDERRQVEMMAAANPEIREEINAISAALEEYAFAHAMEPSPVVKPLLMATIDYSERIKSGEPVTFPPALNENSKVEDYSPWLDRPDMHNGLEENLFVKIIGNSPGMITAIAWIKDETPREIHHDEYERFLIVEGNCDIIIGDKTNHLVPGEYFSIPLHEYHTLKVTSSIACKAILQRVAA